MPLLWARRGNLRRVLSFGKTRRHTHVIPTVLCDRVYVNKNKSREMRQDIRATIQLRNDDSVNQVGLRSRAVP